MSLEILDTAEPLGLFLWGSYIRPSCYATSSLTSWTGINIAAQKRSSTLGARTASCNSHANHVQIDLVGSDFNLSVFFGYNTQMSRLCVKSDNHEGALPSLFSLGDDLMSKVAILIDGSYFLKRLPSIRQSNEDQTALDIAKEIDQMVNNHLKKINETENAKSHYSLLYRCFYYDGIPYMNKVHMPISKNVFDYANSSTAVSRNELFIELRKKETLPFVWEPLCARDHGFCENTHKRNF